MLSQHRRVEQLLPSLAKEVAVGTTPTAADIGEQAAVGRHRFLRTFVAAPAALAGGVSAALASSSLSEVHPTLAVVVGVAGGFAAVAAMATLFTQGAGPLLNGQEYENVTGWVQLSQQTGGTGEG